MEQSGYIYLGSVLDEQERFQKRRDELAEIFARCENTIYIMYRGKYYNRFHFLVFCLPKDRSEAAIFPAKKIADLLESLGRMAESVVVGIAPMKLYDQPTITIDYSVYIEGDEYVMKRLSEIMYGDKDYLKIQNLGRAGIV